MFIEFLKENFFYLHPGYTTFNTIIFGVVLGAIILSLIKFFDKLEVDPLNLIYSLIPIIIFGSTSRALVDNQIYPRIYLLATPGIYISIGLLTILLLVVSVYVEKHYNIQKNITIFVTGTLVCVPNLVLMLINGVNFSILLLELSLWLFFTLIFVLLRNRFSLLKVKGNLEVLSAHIFDATSTFVAMDFFGYYEQHVLPTFMIDIAGTAFIMYPLKIFFLVIILYILDREVDDMYSNHMMKLAIFILGLAPGIRNFATLILSMS